MHLRNFFQPIHWVLLQNFYQINWICKANMRLKFRKYTTHLCTKMSRRENLCFLTSNFQSRQNYTIWNLGFTLPLRILLKRWTLSFKKDTSTAKTVSQLLCLARSTQKSEIYLANEGSGLEFFSTDLGHVFGSNVGNEFGVMFRGKGPHKPEIAYDIVHIHSLMIYMDLIECNIVGDTKVPLQRCFPFISKLKAGDIITTGQYMNYQTFNNLQFRPQFKNTFHSIHIDLRDTSGEKLPFVSVGVTRLVLMFRKASNVHF